PPPTTPPSPLSLHDALPIYPSARRVHRTRRRSQEARPKRLGERGDGSADLAQDLRFSSRTRLGAAEDAGPQTQGSGGADGSRGLDRKSTRLNSSHEWISYAV